MAIDPDNDHPLYQRLVGLLSHRSCDLPSMDIDRLARSSPGEEFREPFVVRVREPGDPCERATRWLDQANPAFGGETPRCYLAGTDEQQQYLTRVIAAIEHGAFS